MSGPSSAGSSGCELGSGTSGASPPQTWSTSFSESGLEMGPATQATPSNDGMGPNGTRTAGLEQFRRCRITLEKMREAARRQKTVSGEITKGMEALTEALDTLSQLWDKVPAGDSPLRMDKSVQKSATRTDQFTQTGRSSLLGEEESYAQVVVNSGPPKRTALKYAW